MSTHVDLTVRCEAAYWHFGRVEPEALRDGIGQQGQPIGWTLSGCHEAPGSRKLPAPRRWFWLTGLAENGGGGPDRFLPPRRRA